MGVSSRRASIHLSHDISLLLSFWLLFFFLFVLAGGDASWNSCVDADDNRDVTGSCGFAAVRAAANGGAPETNARTVSGRTMSREPPVAVSKKHRPLMVAVAGLVVWMEWRSFARSWPSLRAFVRGLLLRNVIRTCTYDTFCMTFLATDARWDQLRRQAENRHITWSNTTNNATMRAFLLLCMLASAAAFFTGTPLQAGARQVRKWMCAEGYRP